MTQPRTVKVREIEPKTNMETNETNSQIIPDQSKSSYVYPLCWNVHDHLQPPSPCGHTALTRGSYAYFHYGCDGFADRGWGCGYRTLQSTCSWIMHKRGRHDTQVVVSSIPSIREIQQTLVRIGDKTPEFLGSRDWIGTVEVCYVVDAVCDVACKIVHIRRGGDEVRNFASQLLAYFEDFGGFAMMGGDMDAASKGIAGVHISDGGDAFFLVIDPHYEGVPKSADELIEHGYIRWRHTSEFVDSSFYNICLPQLK